VGAFATIIIGAIGILMILEGGHRYPVEPDDAGDFFMYGVFIGSRGTAAHQHRARSARKSRRRSLGWTGSRDPPAGHRGRRGRGAGVPLSSTLPGHLPSSNVSLRATCPAARSPEAHLVPAAAAGLHDGPVGSSGAGKSTLINLVLTFKPPESRAHSGGRFAISPPCGSRLPAGSSASCCRTTSCRRPIAEEHRVRPAARDPARTSKRTARIAHCDEFVRRFEKGYDTVVDGKRGVKLSGCERSGFSIARAILADPRILILDEPRPASTTESEAAIQDGCARCGAAGPRSSSPSPFDHSQRRPDPRDARR